MLRSACDSLGEISPRGDLARLEPDRARPPAPPIHHYFWQGSIAAISRRHRLPLITQGRKGSRLTITVEGVYVRMDRRLHH